MLHLPYTIFLSMFFLPSLCISSPMFPSSFFLSSIQMHILKLYKPFHICILVIILSTFAIPTLSTDEKFAACAPQTCGNGQEISYPFWLSHQQESFCGYPNFEIICSHENPILRISNDDYIIKEIFYSNHSFLVANAAVYNEKCSVPQNNFSLDGTPFSFRSDPVNFSFFYNCTSEPSEKIFPYRVNCVSNETHHSFAAFHVEALQHMNYSFSSCESLVRVPANIASGVEFNSLLNMNYTEILEMGFLLNWNAHSCGSCETSGGRCGLNANEFICFCDDRPHKKTCDDGNSVDFPISSFGSFIIMIF